MNLKTFPTPQFPITEGIKDLAAQQFGKDISDILSKIIRDIYDDLVALEKVERVTSLPTANSDRRGKFVLLEGTGGGADGLFLCGYTGSGRFKFKIATFT